MNCVGVYSHVHCSWRAGEGLKEQMELLKIKSTNVRLEVDM